jgi:hypothetical protein
MRYYLHRIHQVLISWNASNKNKKMDHYLLKQVIKDLNLWRMDFLPLIQYGMSLNLISYRWPSYICWSDACPSGLGGFDQLGNAW